MMINTNIVTISGLFMYISSSNKYRKFTKELNKNSAPAPLLNFLRTLRHVSKIEYKIKAILKIHVAQQGGKGY